MEEQIKELRVKIDGLALLTRNLGACNLITVNVQCIPEQMSVTEWIEFLNTTGVGPIYPEQSNSTFPPVTSIGPTNLSKSNDSLILAKAWLGKVLAELGVESPYKSGYKTVEDIEPTADVAKVVPGMKDPFKAVDNPTTSPIDTYELNGESMSEYESFSHIGKIDYIRTKIEELINEVKLIETTGPIGISTRDKAIARTNCYNHLSEARFWLGFELQRIKEENK